VVDLNAVHHGVIRHGGEDDHDLTAGVGRRRGLLDDGSAFCAGCFEDVEVAQIGRSVDGHIEDAITRGRPEILAEVQANRVCCVRRQTGNGVGEAAGAVGKVVALVNGCRRWISQASGRDRIRPRLARAAAIVGIRNPIRAADRRSARVDLLYRCESCCGSRDCVGVGACSAGVCGTYAIVVGRAGR